MLTRETSGREREGRISDPKRIADVAAQFSMVLADDDEIRVGRQIAASLISDGIASADTFIAMQHLTGASVFVLREKGAVTGMLGFFPLRPSGLKAIEEGRFDAVQPDWTLVSRAGEEPAAVYGWGFAATTPAGGSAAVRLSVALQRQLFWGMPVFTRTATPDGVRVITGRGGMGYKIYREDDPTLVWIPGSQTPPERSR